MLYQWHGADEPLGSPVYVAQSLSIVTFAETGEILKATGRISTMDYMENCNSSQGWIAEGHRGTDGIITWDVQNDPEGQFCWEDQNGRPMFTLAKVFDDAIEALVKTQLGVYISATKDEHGVAKTEVPKIHDGPMAEYRGPCVCPQLATAKKDHPFPWKAMTNDGQFPQKCFTCSCGRDWWNYNPEEGFWGPVPDQRLFSDLLDYNGVPQKATGSMQDGFYYLQTLRDHGLVPIG